MNTEIKKGKVPTLQRMKPSEMDLKPGKEQRAQRTRGSKVYRLGENVYQAVIYPDAVHYQDKKTGVWQEIDNTLVEHENKRSGRYLSNKRNGDFKVELFGALEEQMVRLTDADKHSISWSLEEAVDVSPEIERRDVPPHAKDDLRRKVLDTLESNALYKGILPDTDLRCVLRGGSFKDEMIFHSTDAVRPIALRVFAPGLKMEQTEDGEILFKDEQNEVAFGLPVPYLSDANEDVASVKVIMEAADQKYGCRIVYIPDIDWAQKAAYPVVLDPAVRTKNLAASLMDNFVASKKPNYVYPYGNTNLQISKGNTTYGTAYSYLQFLQNDLPAISSSYYVTKAYLHMALKGKPSANVVVYAREVLESWSDRTITWNNKPAVSDKYLDYLYFGANSTPDIYHTYDISNLVRKWYAGVNFGIRFEPGSNTNMSFNSSNSAYYKPYVVINFVSLAGSQSGLSYETQSAGRAGAGQVSLYNGNLVFTHQDTSMNGNLMPVSVSHVYNSCYYKKNPFGTGYGWTVSAQQYLHREVLPSATSSTSTTTYYVYTDETGARHFFKQTSGKWKDLSGLSLELTISGNTATITSKSDTRMIFDLPTVDFDDDDEDTSIAAFANVKPLKQIIDACGNTATFTTDTNRRLTKITDGAGRETVFTQSGNQIVSIKEPGAPQVDFTYTNDKLSTITYYDKLDESNQPVPQYATFVYNDLGLLETVTNIDGLQIIYSYTETFPHRVSCVKMRNNGTYFGGRKYEYKDCLTVVTDLVVDSNNELVEGKKLFYHFNDNGNVVSVNDELGYGCFAQYTDNMPTNHPEILSRMQRSVVNLLKNHNLETATNWTNQTLASATGSYANATTYYYMGAKSLAMTRTNAVGQLTSYQAVNITKGKTYTFSAYYRTTSAAKAQLRVTYMDENGASVNEESQALQSTAGWDRLSMTFEVPENSTSASVTVRLMAVENTGVVYFDCAQLEEGAVANPYNMLENGDFTFNVNGKPQSWLENSSNAAEDKVYAACTGVKPQGLSPNTLRLYGGGRTKYPGIYQDIKQTGSKGDVYAAGGWSLNYSKPRKGEDKRYNIRVAFLKKGTSSTRENAKSIEWSEEWTDWQFAAGPVIAPCDYTSIRFNVDYERNINYAEFGGLFLYKEEFGKTFAYDDNSNITSVKNLAAQQSHATYDDYNNLLTYRQPGRPDTVKYTLNWGSTTAEKKKHLLLKTTSPLGIIQENKYDNSNGNPTETKTRNGDSTKIIRSTTAYTENGNYIAAQTDARGNSVQSTYDLTKGTLSKVKNPNNQETEYTYDLAKRAIKTESTADGKTYLSENTYAQDKLVKTTHKSGTGEDIGDVAYNFGYDGLGRQTTVSVGPQASPALLSSTSYNNDGTVSEIVYGNDNTGDPVTAHRVRYSYDEFKRLKGVRFGNGNSDAYKYEYGANGQVGRLRDTILGREYVSEYDTANRPMRMIQKENGHHLYTGQVEYDQYNNLKLFKEKVGNPAVEYRTDFAGYDDENKPTKMTFGSENSKIEYLYDGIGRMQKRTLTVSGHAYETNYTYLAGANGGNTTALISGISQGTSADGLTYEYDNMGNITKVTRGTGENAKETSYVYDSMGQLIRVNDQTDTTSSNDGTTWVYEYDCGGNILSKTRYPYTTETPAVDGVTINYTYGNSNWKDQLTEYNGATIQYDNIGNPTDDGTWTYTWENGRQLKEMSKGTVGTEGYMKIEYHYNAEGLRVQKIVTKTTASGTTTTTTDYILHGKNIVHLTQGNHNLHFFYDAGNKPAIVEFNETRYGYVQNLQGDIIQIIDANGVAVVEYTYDAWGKVLNVTGSMAGSLGTVQPFRYRGYVYDVETELYYLESRYYNSEVERFLNADKIIDISDQYSSNLFSYCGNAPIRYYDDSGNSFWDALRRVGEAALKVAAVAIVVAIVIGTGGAAGMALAAGGAISAAASAGFVATSAVAVGAAGATAILIADSGEAYFSKQTKKGGKEKASDKPSWVNSDMVDNNLSAQENATRLLDNKYGVNNWQKGPNTEYNKIVKWIQRSLFND